MVMPTGSKTNPLPFTTVLRHCVECLLRFGLPVVAMVYHSWVLQVRKVINQAAAMLLSCRCVAHLYCWNTSQQYH